MYIGMEILIIIAIASVVLFVGAVGHDMGYKKREREFQDNAVTFCIGRENALHVERRNGKMNVIIYNKNLVELNHTK